MNKQQQITVLVLLVLIGGGIWGWQYWPAGGGSGNASNSSFLHDYKPLNFPNSQLDWPTEERRHKAEYKPSGINLFSNAGPQPPAPPPQKLPQPGDKDYVPPVAPPPPMPDLPAGMKFFGYGNVPNNTARRAFLEDGDQVYIVSEGDTLMGRYRIVKINNASIEFEEIGSGRRGQKALEDQGPTA